MSSIFSATQESKPLRHLLPVPRLPLGSALLVLGAVLLLFGVFLAPLIPADLRSGHRFWIRIVTADEIIALALLVAGICATYLRRKS